MAGILAVSAEQVMTAPDTAVDKSVSGYVTNSQITLSTTPTGSSYSWAIAKPSGSTARAALSSATAEAPVFTPDVPGYYTVSVVVDSTTTYVIRISVTQTAITTSYEAIRLSPKADASVPAPALGVAMYYSSDQDALVIKDAAGDVYTVDLTAV